MKRVARFALSTTLLLCAILCSAQSTSKASSGEPAGGAVLPLATPAHTFAQLNLLGADVRMPAFEDTEGGTTSEFRRVMLQHGMAFRINNVENFSFNLLDPPVDANQVSYTGQRPYGKVMLNPIITMDLNALHIHSAQLNVSAAFEWVSWQKSGPSAINLSTLYIFKSFDEGRLELKAGYFGNNQEYVGFTVGGSMGPGAQGVYSVLPYEAGLSYLPITTPGINLKVNLLKHLYVKGGLQRSTDPTGGITTVNRNPAGTRFMPKGDKLLTIVEGGFNRPASNGALATWVRGGYIHNTTQYPNYLAGGTSSGNYSAYLLADRQMFSTYGPRASNGLYLGGSAEIAPARMNSYSQYYEFRTYMQGPFKSRPLDQASLLITRSMHSQDLMRNLIAQGKTVWRHTDAFTVSYTVHAARGTFFSAGLSYMQGPAITPRVPNAFIATLAANTFF